MPLVILGDFNLHVSKEKATVEQMELASSCKQIVKGSTTSYGTTLELVFTNCPAANVWNVASAHSYNNLIFCTF